MMVVVWLKPIAPAKLAYYIYYCIISKARNDRTMEKCRNNACPAVDAIDDFGHYFDQECHP